MQASEEEHPQQVQWIQYPLDRHTKLDNEIPSMFSDVHLRAPVRAHVHTFPTETRDITAPLANLKTVFLSRMSCVTLTRPAKCKEEAAASKTTSCLPMAPRRTSAMSNWQRWLNSFKRFVVSISSPITPPSYPKTRSVSVPIWHGFSLQRTEPSIASPRWSQCP